MYSVCACRELGKIKFTPGVGSSQPEGNTVRAVVKCDIGKLNGSLGFGVNNLPFDKKWFINGEGDFFQKG